MTASDRFELQRARLVGLGYRMLGSRADAEDVVQDAWFRWTQADRSAIENDEAYLTTIVTRLCLDRMKAERVRRQTYKGPWLPEPIADAAALSAQATSEFADDLSYALLLSLERLSALERAAFLLHDVFDTPFAEVATTLERSEDAVRQLAARARKAVREAKPSRPPTPGMHEKLLYAFGRALHEGDADGLKAVLRQDAVFISDGGGRRPAATRPVHGADRIVRLLLGVRRMSASQAESYSAATTTINGSAAFLLYRDGALEQMLTIEVDDECIAAVYTVRNPEKLAALMPVGFWNAQPRAN
jgi:RNA polymerase sigma-70 factor, ECF subfamily